MLDEGVSLGEIGDVKAGLDADPDVIEGRRFAVDDDEVPRVREGDRRRNGC